ncbi:PREDICTED: uncharacterized protein LOC106104250 isoform X2 [Papilio polytes]|uniref:uncharacterized protein LOC106104250 isoform X2 n=1 Tax=Papilio polytes TaxID=76194 RepID=UPI00067645BF|nr:PREDICTED: uncharacterized protein LOC106104250 isoform X2 [Papilio polytes]
MYTIVEIVLSVGVIITLITALSACVCGCKNSNQKASTQNSQRSLPEIPHPVGRHDSGDTASEIYATVNLDEGSKPAPTASTSRDHPYEHAYAKLQNENHNITVDITPDQESEREIQIDEREASQPGPESVVISASVAISGQLPSSQELPYITPPSPRPPPPALPPALPLAPPPADNTLHFSGDSTDSAKGYTSISVREPLSNIRAQGVKHSAQPHYATVSDDSDEMYAAIEEASVGEGEGSDTYAQIAPEPRRRDPAPAAPAPAAAAAPGPATAPAAPPLSELATRRSAPPEIGASTSQATHSRQASSSSCSNSTGALGSPKPEKRVANSPLPPPPLTTHAAHAAHGTHVAHVAHVTHGTHAPLTQSQRHNRISSTGDLHFNHDKLRRSLNEKHQRNNSCVSSSDFYGCNYPVEKHRFSSGDLVRPLVATELHFDIDHQPPPADNLYNSIDGPAPSDYSSADANISIDSDHRVTESPSRNLDDMYAKVNKKGKTKPEDTSKKLNEFSKETETALKFRGDDPGYETIDRKKSNNHGYETITHKERNNSQNQDPGYETVKDVNKTLSTFTNNNLLKLNHLNDSGPNSIISSDPGYEHITKPDNSASDSDPNYEVLRNQPPTPPYATIAPDYKVQPTYSTVHKRTGKYNNWPANNNDEGAQEPNYESMSNDPFYTTGSESDPNYESVRPKDPNYESVNAQDPNYESLRCKDPKYESVRSKDSKYDSVRSKKDPNYESVKYFELSQKEPPYEKVNNDAGTNSVERSDSAAGYEKINVPANRDPKNSINSGADGIVSDYFQV